MGVGGAKPPALEIIAGDTAESHEYISSGSGFLLLAVAETSAVGTAALYDVDTLVNGVVSDALALGLAVERVSSLLWMVFMLGDGAPRCSSASVLSPAVSESSFQELFDGDWESDDESAAAVVSPPLIGLGKFGREVGLSSRCSSLPDVADVLLGGGVA